MCVLNIFEENITLYFMDSLCPIQGIIEIISKKWVLQIFKSLLSGVDSFSWFQKEIPGINSRTLSERLVELEAYGFINREIISTRPIKIKYSPTYKCEWLVKEFDKIEKLIRSWEETK